MNGEAVTNKADFQRHLNGCERRLNDLTTRLQSVEKVAQKLQVLHARSSEVEVYFDQLDDISDQIQFLDSSLSTLVQSSFAAQNPKRLELLQTNVETNRRKFEQMQQYARIKFGYDYQANDSVEDGSNVEQQEQLVKMMPQSATDELNASYQRTLTMNTLEEDLSGIREAFIDMNRLVHEQGARINTIEGELTVVTEMTSQGKEEVKRIVKVKRRTSRVRCVVVSVVIGACLLVAVIVYISLKLASPFRLQ